MSYLGSKFMVAALGLDGSAALRKAAEREPQLDQVLIPRTIVGWLNFTTAHEFEGTVPGVPNSYVQFQKSDKGFSGSITLDEEVYGFEQASVYHLAASIAVALGIETDSLDPDVRDTVLVKLGKSIDTLIKAQVLMQELKSPKTLGLSKKVLDPNAGYTFHHEHHDLGGGDTITHIKAIHSSGETVGEAAMEYNSNTPGPMKPDVSVHPEHRRKGIASAMYAHAEKVTGRTVAPSSAQSPDAAALHEGNKGNPQFGIKKAGGAEGAGPAHAATKPKGPEQAIAPGKQPSQGQATQGAAPKTTLPKQPGRQGTPTLKPSLPVGKSESQQPCEICDGQQFENNRFKGCICFRNLSKSIRTTAYRDGYVLDFDSSVDADTVRALMRVFRSRNG